MQVSPECHWIPACAGMTNQISVFGFYLCLSVCISGKNALASSAKILPLIQLHSHRLPIITECGFDFLGLAVVCDGDGVFAFEPPEVYATAC